VALSAVVLHELAHDGALGVPDGEAGTQLVGEGEQVELVGEATVVALLGLLEHGEVLVELGLGLPGRAVDALEHGVALVAPPVGAGDPRELEVPEVAPRVGHVRAPAEVDEAGRVLVGADEARLRRRRRVVGRAPDDLALVLVGGEELQGLRVGDLVAQEGLALPDDLAHLGVQALEVLGGEGAPVGQLEVVVEAVLDGRPDGEGGTGEQLEHGLGEHVRGRVPDRVAAPLAVRGDDRHGVAVPQGGDEIAFLAVDLGDHRGLGEAPADARGEVPRGGAGLQHARGAVRQADADLCAHRYRSWRRRRRAPRATASLMS
jgi:hypothetical protein